MAKRPRTITVSPGSEMATTLQEVAVRPVLLDQGGTLFVVELDEPFARPFRMEGAATMVGWSWGWA